MHETYFKIPIHLNKVLIEEQFLYNENSVITENYWVVVTIANIGIMTC